MSFDYPFIDTNNAYLHVPKLSAIAMLQEQAKIPCQGTFYDSFPRLFWCPNGNLTKTICAMCMNYDCSDVEDNSNGIFMWGPLHNKNGYKNDHMCSCDSPYITKLLSVDDYELGVVINGCNTSPSYHVECKLMENEQGNQNTVLAIIPQARANIGFVVKTPLSLNDKYDNFRVYLEIERLSDGKKGKSLLFENNKPISLTYIPDSGRSSGSEITFTSFTKSDRETKPDSEYSKTFNDSNRFKITVHAAIGHTFKNNLDGEVHREYNCSVRPIFQKSRGVTKISDVVTYDEDMGVSFSGGTCTDGARTSQSFNGYFSMQKSEELKTFYFQIATSASEEERHKVYLEQTKDDPAFVTLAD